MMFFFFLFKPAQLAQSHPYALLLLFCPMLLLFDAKKQATITMRCKKTTGVGIFYLFLLAFLLAQTSLLNLLN